MGVYAASSGIQVDLLSQMGIQVYSIHSASSFDASFVADTICEAGSSLTLPACWNSQLGTAVEV